MDSAALESLITVLFLSRVLPHFLCLWLKSVIVMSIDSSRDSGYLALAVV